MNLKGSEKYRYKQLRDEINTALTNKQFNHNIYQSTNGILRVLNAIVKTDGQNWASHVLDENGNPLLTPVEQQQFTDAFQNHIDDILQFFGKQSGGNNDVNDQYIESLVNSSDDQKDGIDDLYTTFIDKIRSMDQVVNDYASQYGVLKLEKEHDMMPDIPLIPETVTDIISSGLSFFVPADITKEALSKLKIPFRTIVSTIYIALDIARLTLSLKGQESQSKILSVLLSILELLRGDWKKSILSFIGYYGMTPLLYGQLGKVFLTSFRMFSPDLQDDFVFGSFDATKSFIIGILLSIFQVTAPQEIRLPIIAALDKIRLRKERINGVLEQADLPARPNYLSPTFQDLNNIQAIMTDPAYVCSCEFEELVKAVDKSAIIRTILELLRIPVTKEFIEYKCGKEPCKPFVTELVQDVKEQSNESSPSENIEKMETTPTENIVEKTEVAPSEVTEKVETTPSENIVEKTEVAPSEVTEKIEVSPLENKGKIEEKVETKPPMLFRPRGGRVLHTIGKKRSKK